MKPSVLLSKPPIRVETEHLYVLENHIWELCVDRIDWSKMPEVSLAYYIDECFDGERGLEMFAVRFNGQPFMICQAAGRGNRDSDSRYIIDKELYRKFVEKVALLLIDEKPTEAVNPDEDVPGLDEFYGVATSRLYDSELKPEYKEGDIVLARVMENHLRDSYAFEKTKYVWTRCRVDRVRQYNPENTYHLSQLDRRWANEVELNGAKRFEMAFEKDKGSIGASGNDTTIIPLDAQIPDQWPRV